MEENVRHVSLTQNQGFIELFFFFLVLGLESWQCSQYLQCMLCAALVQCGCCCHWVCFHFRFDGVLWAVVSRYTYGARGNFPLSLLCVN